MTELTEEVRELIKKENPRMLKIYNDCGLFRILEADPLTIYKNYNKNLSFESIACMLTNIFVNDERITNIMSIRSELAKTATVLKTDFTFIIADSLGIGRNKASTLIDQAISQGFFTVLPNIYDVNAKMLRPTKINDNELHRIYVRISEINHETVSAEGFVKFKEGL